MSHFELFRLRAAVDRWRESQARRSDFWEKAYREGLAAGRALAEADHRAEAAAGQRAEQELADAALTAGQATGDEHLARRVYEARFREPFADTYESTRRMYVGIATATRVAHERRQSGVALLPCGCAPIDPPKDCPYRADATAFSDRERVWVHGEPLSSRRDGRPTEAA